MRHKRVNSFLVIREKDIQPKTSVSYLGDAYLSTFLSMI